MQPSLVNLNNGDRP
jgi:hypothetical protein